MDDFKSREQDTSDDTATLGEQLERLPWKPTDYADKDAKWVHKSLVPQKLVVKLADRGGKTRLRDGSVVYLTKAGNLNRWFHH